MNTATACKILELDTPFTSRELKKAYYKCALYQHPDRNIDTSIEIHLNKRDNSTSQFQETASAYEFLTIQLELKDEISSSYDTSINTDYSNIIKNFIETCLELTKTNIPATIKRITEKALCGLDKHILQQVLCYINNYGDILADNRENIKIVIDIINDKLSQNNIYNVETTIDNLFHAEIFKLHVNEEIYYIPLWHNEVEYDKDCTRLTVKCITNLPEHVCIDDNNDIHVNIKISLQTILKNMHIDIFLGNKVFKIPVEELFIRQKQDFLFYKKGIPKINVNDIYCADNIGNIVIHISLTE